MYSDRREAGQWLGRRLRRRYLDRGAVVVAASRDAVPVAYEVASALAAPLRLTGEETGASLDGRIAIVVVEGVASGGTARAACSDTRTRGAKRVVLAVPVGGPDAVDALRDVADEIESPLTPHFFRAIGDYYLDDSPLPATEATRLLNRAADLVG